ncbi:hypothetical protein ACHQM5_009393 [Ranunculus cassubicifolius]
MAIDSTITPTADSVTPTSTTPNTNSNEKISDSIASQSASQSNNSRVVDPYIIHPSENPTAVFFSPQLQGDNYGPWVRGISKALNAKGKLGFVDGSIPRPSPSEPILLNCWKRCDDLVGSWILNSVSTEIRTSCMYAESASDIWNDLKVRFSVSNAPKLYQLKNAISSLKQDDLPVQTYFTRLRSLWDEYDSLLPGEPCICGASKFLLEKHQRDRAMEFLQGLHDRFSSLRSQILLIEPLPVAQKIFQLVKQEEDQQLINASSSPNIDGATLNFSRNDHSSGRFSKSSGSNIKGQKRQRPFCDHCNRHGHTRQTCYQLHGFPTNRSRDSTSATSNAVAAATSSMAPYEMAPPFGVPPLSAEQYTRLLSLLAPSSGDTEMISSTNLAGPSNEKSDWSG